MSCGYSVNVTAFKKFALDTARLYVKLYEWYPMPASVHRILIHGSEAIEMALLPIGMLSEEAQEARHKDLRKIRELRSRKTSRIDMMQDMLNALLISSDPFLSSLRKTSTKKNFTLKEAIANLINVEADISDEDE